MQRAHGHLADVSFSTFFYKHFTSSEYSSVLNVLHQQFKAGKLGNSDREITRNARSLLKESFMRVAPAEDSIAFMDLMNTWLKDNLNLIKDPLAVSRGYLPPSATEQPVRSGASNVIQDTSGHVPPDEEVRSKVIVPPETGRVDADLPDGVAPRPIPQAVDEVDRSVYGKSEYAQVGTEKFKQMLNVLMQKYKEGSLDNVSAQDSIRRFQILTELRSVGVDDIKTALVDAYLKAMRAENGGYLGRKRPPPAVKPDKALVVAPLPAQRLEGVAPAAPLDGANVTPTLEIKPVAVLQRDAPPQTKGGLTREALLKRFQAMQLSEDSQARISVEQEVVARLAEKLPTQRPAVIIEDGSPDNGLVRQVNARWNYRIYWCSGAISFN